MIETVIFMYICRIQYRYTLGPGEDITGPVWRYYNLFHFYEPVEIEVDGVRVRTEPNACILSEPAQKRGFYFSETTRMNWIHCYQEFSKLIEQYKIPVNQVFYPKDPGVVEDLFFKMRVEFLQRYPNREELLDQYMRCLMITLGRVRQESKEAFRVPFREQWKLLRLRRLILAQPERRWSVAEMAEEVSLSPSRFYAVYKGYFGVPPMQEVINTRIAAAKNMLVIESWRTIPEIAEKLGYGDQYHFIRQFKQHTGITPATYRKKHM